MYYSLLEKVYCFGFFAFECLKMQGSASGAPITRTTRETARATYLAEASRMGRTLDYRRTNHH